MGSCNTGLECSDGVCRNISCIDESDCNCPPTSSITGPSTIILGQTGSYTATARDRTGGVSIVSIHVSPYSTFSVTPSWTTIGNKTDCGGSTPCQLINVSWTPTTTGEYYIVTTASKACTGNRNPWCNFYLGTINCSPNYSCGSSGYIHVIVNASALTPTRTPTPTPSPTPTPTPSNWYKLKNASLYKIGAIDLNIASPITAFDPSDDGSRNLVIGNPGVVSSTGDITFHSSTSFVSSTKGWQNTNYPFSAEALINNFYDYIKARKTYEVTTIDSVITNKVNVIKTSPLSIDADTLTGKTPIILVVRKADDSDYGDLTITADSDYSNAVFLAKTITFEEGVKSVSGIFIANSIVIKENNDGLKIVGNLISNTAVTIPDRDDTSKPSLFVVVDPDQYISLLPLISTSKYDFQQTQ